MSRRYTNKLLEMIEDGYVTNELIVNMALSWLSEQDVFEMMVANELLEEPSEDEIDDYCDDME